MCPWFSHLWINDTLPLTQLKPVPRLDDGKCPETPLQMSNYYITRRPWARNATNPPPPPSATIPHTHTGTPTSWERTTEDTGGRLLDLHALLSSILGCPSVHPSTVLPDLSLRASKWIDVPHLDHRFGEVRVKRLRVSDVLPDEGVGRATIEEHLVWIQETLLVDQVLEVVVVKDIGSLDVERCQVVIAGVGISRAARLPRSSKGGVDVGLIVYPGSEGHAASLS